MANDVFKAQAGAEVGGRRTRQLGSALVAIAVLAAVGIVAATTGGHGHSKPAASIAVPPTGKVHPGPVPPLVAFADAQLGYALFTGCAKQPDGEGCQAQLYRTVNGGGNWSLVGLPPGAPVDTTSWVGLDAHSTEVMLTWTGGGTAVSADRGDHWKQAHVLGSTSAVRATDFLLGSELVVDPVKGTAATFRPPPQIELAGEAGGQLSDGTLWLEDDASYGLSYDDGNSWNSAPVTDTNVAVEPKVDAQGHLVRVTGPVAGLTLGRFGDGGELAATTALFSTNQGKSWVPTALTGRRVNAGCTVLLDDGSLLGVAADGTALLSLPAGASAFAPVTGGPPSMPMCLTRTGQQIWGVTFDGSVVVSKDGKSWISYALPPGAGGVPTASPTPSAK